MEAELRRIQAAAPFSRRDATLPTGQVGERRGARASRPGFNQRANSSQIKVHKRQ
jgi:hypothetical protein